jgi:hypothetical protein
VRWLDVLACYAASVALNGVLPANLGTLALLLMFTSIIAGATFAGILGAYAVEKIFFTLIGAFTYLYLFLSVGGSFDIKFSFVKDHPWAVAIFLLGSAYLIFVIFRRLWPRLFAGGRRRRTAARSSRSPGSTSFASSCPRSWAGSRASA